MTDRDFDWTEILPERDRAMIRADLESRKGTFLEGFPTREELDEAGRQGQAAFNRACAIVDNRNETERLLNAAMDHIAGTLQQPSDPRAWDHLLVYCPREALESRLRAGQALSHREPASTCSEVGKHHD